MRVLLDECVPHPLRHVIGPGHDVSTVAYRGWGGIQNGRLLRLMRDVGIGILVTRDGNLSKQQNLVAAGIGVIVMSARNKIIRSKRCRYWFPQ